MTAAWGRNGDGQPHIVQTSHNLGGGTQPDIGTAHGGRNGDAQP